MSAETRLGTTAIAASAVVLLGLAIVEALDQFGASPVLPALFPAIPLGIAIVVAFARRSLDFADVARGGWISSRAVSAAAAATALSGVMLVAAPIGMALGGAEGLVLIACLVGGLLLAWLRVVPMLRAEAGATLASSIGQLFGRPARAAAAIAVVLLTLALLMAETSLAGLVGARMLGIPAPLGRMLLLGLGALAALLGGLGSSLAVAAVLLPTIAIAFLAPVAIVSLGESHLPMPWIGLFDPSLLNGPSRISPLVLGAVAACLVFGIAVLPNLLFPAAVATPRPTRRTDLTAAIFLVAIVLLAAPSYAVYGKIAGIDATTDPAGLVLAFPDHVGLSATPSVLLIGGLLAAALVAATSHLSTAAMTIGHDLYGAFAERRTPEARQLFIARLAIVAITALILFALQRWQLGSAAMWAGIGLSLTAAALAPAILFGPFVGHRRALAGASAIWIGLWLTLADIVLARFFPNAGAYLGMRIVTDTVLGPTGWFGLPIGLSGVIGFGYGLAVLLLLPAVLRFPWRMAWIRLRLAIRHRRRRRSFRPAAVPAAISTVAAPAALPAPAPMLALPAPQPAATEPTPPAAPVVETHSA